MLGRNVGNYTVVRKLGEGGMGAVFEALHPSIGRRAAVKVLHPGIASSPDLVGRFFNEARAANLVQHPGMVAVFDYGVLDDGTAYIVMELLVGETLTARLARAGGRLGLDAVRFVRQVAGALAAAHDGGVVHRDLKPDNVMIVADPETPGGERIKVLDFGIAKLAEQHASTGAGQTRTGAVMGTPLYMSPEQCRGAGAIDDRVDVYSLGAMLYHLLAGRPPFDGEGIGAIMARHIYQPPPRLDGVAPELAALVERMLGKVASARPRMVEVDRWLAAWLAGAAAQSVPAAPAATMPGATTTLGGAAAQALATLAVSPRRVWGRRALTAGGVVAAVVATVVTREHLGGAAEDGGAPATIPIAAASPAVAASPAPPPAEPPARVRWHIVTAPPGALVVDASGAVIGVTPLELERDAAPGTLRVSLRLAGHRAYPLELDTAKDNHVTAALGREKPRRSSSGRARAPDPAPPAPPPAPATNPSPEGAHAPDLHPDRQPARDRLLPSR